MIPISTAFDHIQATVHPRPLESTPLTSAVGKILATDVHADMDSPPHNKSVMDGYAVRASDVNSGRLELNVVETIVAGSWPQQTVEPGCAARIMTGAPMPQGADCVVMIEKTTEVQGTSSPRVEIGLTEITEGHHMMPRATNFSRGDKVFEKGHPIQPSDVGLLAEVGQVVVDVYKPPTVAVLPTGDELVSAEELPGPAQIRNSNGPMLVAMNQSLGFPVHALGVGRDDEAQLRQLVEKGLQSDILILSGGVSAGMLDLVPKVLANCGVEEVFHKVAVKPGKPIWFGQRLQDGHRTYVFGLPGNPVSSLVGFHLFVRHAIACMFEKSSQQRYRRAVLTADHQTRGNRPTFWPGKLTTNSLASRQVQPIAWNGSSDLRALGAADCLIHFPLEKQDYMTNDEVDIWPLSSSVQ
jgi:molybdopterin molybdotransferase